MTVYARSDVCSIAIPVSSGGCGEQHMRTVIRGVPDKTFALDCPPCESYLRGDSRPKKLVYETDPKTGPDGPAGARPRRFPINGRAPRTRCP